MNSIRNNPYRTLGVLTGASSRDLLNRTKKLKMYLEAEQEPDEDFCFAVLGGQHRTIDSVGEAYLKLNLTKDRMQGSIFWFLDGGVADESAFDALKASDMVSAEAIWRKVVASDEVALWNFSGFQNLSNLLLNNAFRTAEVNLKLLESGILLKLKFLESDHWKKLVELSTDETFTITKEELQKNFLKTVVDEATKREVSGEYFLAILSKIPFSAKLEYLKTFTHKPVEKIEKSIEEAKKKRKEIPGSAASTGKSLYTSVISLLGLLKAILGPTDLKFSNLSDKIAEEVLQCGIDYFKYFRDSDIDPGKETMDCLKKAKSVAVGNMMIQRCNENIENLEEWIDDKPNRDRQKEVAKDLEMIKNLIDEYDGRSQTVSNAKEFLNKARPHILNIKVALGSTDELYIGLSTRIASDVQSMLVSEINVIQEQIAHYNDHLRKITAIQLLKQRVDDAWEISSALSNMDLRNDFRIHFNSNRQHLSSLRDQLSKVNVSSGSSSSPSGSSGSSGCYIATMAYGDYNHPQVMELRSYRDEVLSRSNLGRWFIRTYYRYSPRLVKNLKNKEFLNTCIRFLLNQLIKVIKR